MKKKYDTDFLVVGSGAGAVGVISELVLKSEKILVVEQGKRDIDWGKGVNQRGKNIFREDNKFPLSKEGVGYYRHIGLGGTVEISCANGIKPSNRYLSKLKIDIEPQVEHVCKKMGLHYLEKSFMGHNTTQLTKSAQALDLEMVPTPKYINFNKCRKCGLCELICPHQAVWSPRRILEQFEREGKINILDGVKIDHISFNSSKAKTAKGTIDGIPVEFNARIIILAAGGIGTPIILQNSGIEAGHNLFLDLFWVVYGRSKNFDENRDIPMAAVYQHPDDAFMIAPYIDIDIWHGLTKNKMFQWLGGEHTTGLMVKIADEQSGNVNKDGTIKKAVTDKDQNIFRQAVEIARNILCHAGADKNNLTITRPRGAHPGGTAAIGTIVDNQLKVMGTDNLFIADASVLPHALGKPPVVTICALAKRLGQSF